MRGIKIGKKKNETWPLFVGLLLSGMGFGLIFNEPAAGLLLGLGLAFASVTLCKCSCK